MKNKGQLIKNIIGIVLLIFLVVLEFIGHRHSVFCADDLWYATNLVTGEKLARIGDIFVSQYWHFFNWGGRSITHGLLQLTIMSGELFADILNVFISLLLSAVICKFSKTKSIIYFLVVHAAVLAFNPVAYLNMFWQAGAVNYLYSTTWILACIYFYVRQFEDRKYKNAYMIPIMIILGLMTGWSNENMGPGAACIMAGITIYLTIKKGRQPLWMWVGSVMAFIGSLLVIVAPGNFVRGSLVEETLVQKIGNHIVNLSRASLDYIYAALIVTAFLVVLYSLESKLKPIHISLIAYIILANGAMLLSPMYPARATFGVMVLLILLSGVLLSEAFERLRKSGKVLLYVLGGFIYVAALINAVCVINYPVA